MTETDRERKRKADVVGWVMGIVGTVLCGIALWGWALQ